LEQLVPQQRWEELQLGLHMPGPTEVSLPPPSGTPVHAPPTHLPPPQLTPQEPQLLGSESKLAQTKLAPAEQQFCPEVQAGEQLPGGVTPPSPPRVPAPEQPRAKPRLINAAQRSDVIPMSSKVRSFRTRTQASGGARMLSTQAGTFRRE